MFVENHSIVLRHDRRGNNGVAEFSRCVHDKSNRTNAGTGDQSLDCPTDPKVTRGGVDNTTFKEEIINNDHENRQQVVAN